MGTKKCSKCHIEKDLSEFYQDRSAHEAQCKQCKLEYCRVRYLEHKELILLRNKLWTDKNKDRIREYQKTWAKNNPEKVKEKIRRYHTAHPGIQLAATLRWQKNNPEKLKETTRRTNTKRISTIKGKLNNSLSGRMRYSLQYENKNGRHWESLVGFTVHELKHHLESQFSDGMNWGNYGKLWEIDHKIPIAAFNFERPEDIDFGKCWSLENLQPLKARENARKHAKVDIPFQPSLAIAAFISGGGIRKTDG